MALNTNKKAKGTSIDSAAYGDNMYDTNNTDPTAYNIEVTILMPNSVDICIIVASTAVKLMICPVVVFSVFQ